MRGLAIDIVGLRCEYEDKGRQGGGLGLGGCWWKQGMGCV